MYNQYMPGAMTMNPSYGMYSNPYQSRLDAMQQPQQTAPPQRYSIIHVNGENGARTFRMAPDSQCLLLDDTAPIIWLAQTDGAGYPTLTPYSITPYQPEQPSAQQANSDLEERLTRLEAVIYGKPNASAAQQTVQQPTGGSPAADQPCNNDTATPTV